MLFFFLFFDEGLPRKQRKGRMKENIDTTCGGVSDAGSPWARTTYSAPWSVITSAPRSVPLMLKLATLPRSRRERDWWRATPGRSGKDAALPPPAEGPAERTEGCVTRGRRCAQAGCHGRASQGNPAAHARWKRHVSPRRPRESASEPGHAGRACSGDATRTLGAPDSSRRAARSPRSP